MKILKFTKFILGIGGLVAVGGGVPGGTLSASASGLEQIQTRHGALYREVEVLDADRHGLLFRHARGIAKLPFDELSDHLRLLYKPVEGSSNASNASAASGIADSGPASSLPGDGFPGEPGTPPAKAAGGKGDETVAGSTDGGFGTHAIHLVARVRWRVQMPLACPGACVSRFGGAYHLDPCGHRIPAFWAFPGEPAWRSHWPRRSPAPFADFHPTPANRAAALHALLSATEGRGALRRTHSILCFD